MQMLKNILNNNCYFTVLFFSLFFVYLSIMELSETVKSSTALTLVVSFSYGAITLLSIFLKGRCR